MSSLQKAPFSVNLTIDRAAILAPYSGRTWADWTPEERRAYEREHPSPEPRPTASPYEPPTTEDEAWFAGLQCGLERVAAIAPHGYSDAERRAFFIGYEAGWADDMGDDMEEYSEWLDRMDAMHATERDEQDESVARCELGGWGGNDLD